MLNLKNKKVTVMGLGLYEEGSGISAAKFLLSQVARVTVTDLKTEDQLRDQIKRLGGGAKKIKWVLGRHREADFKNVDLIVKNPGVPRGSKYLAIARKNKIPIETDISLFFQLSDRRRIIGVTGTRGKSTTATLIYEFIKASGRPAALGGNIKQSPLAQLAQIKKSDAVVLELSSWLLESLEPIKQSPHIAALTNIYPDHLNTYSGLEDYVEAKKNIFKFQTPQDYIILNRDNVYTRKMGREVIGRRYWFSLREFKKENGCFVSGGRLIFRSNGREQIICPVSAVRLLGEHNLANILAAAAAAMVAGVKPVAIRAVLKKFKGIPDRLEFLKEIRGIKYYNDTTSTTPEATLAALRALSTSSLRKGRPGGIKNIVLIAGGSDKGLDFNVLAKEIKRTCRAAVLFNDSGTKRLQPLISPGKLPSALAGNMADAVGLAKSFARRGDIILLSPACASFGLFKNEFDRGDQFKDMVSQIKCIN